MPSSSTEHVPAPEIDTEEMDDSFPFIRGGLFYRLEERLGLISGDDWHILRRVIVTLTLTWFPLIVLSFASGSLQSALGVLKDYRLLARFVIAIPIFIISERSISLRFHSSIRQFTRTRIIPERDLVQFQRILASTKKLANSVVPESLMLIVVIVLALFVQRDRFLAVSSWGMQAATGSFQSLTKAGWYFLLVSEPIYLMMLTIMLWKWIVWVRLLWKVSRLDLQLTFPHPDRCGGLGFLGFVPEGYAGAIFGVCAGVGAIWRFDIAHHLAELHSYYFPGAGLLIGVLLLMFGPLAFFSLRLTDLRRVGLLQYGVLAHHHAVHFNRKWIADLPRNEPELLSVPEVSTLYDLDGKFQLLMSAKFVPIYPACVLETAAVVLVPMLPVLMTEIPLATLLKEILRALL